MPNYMIHCTVTLEATETWLVEAVDEETAKNALFGGDGGLQFVAHSNFENERDREIVTIEETNPTSGQAPEGATSEIMLRTSEDDWETVFCVLNYAMSGDSTNEDEDFAIRRCISEARSALNREVWLSTVIRKGWEPRLSHFTSKAEMVADALEYAREVVEVEGLADDATIDEIADALGEQANHQLYWEQAR